VPGSPASPSHHDQPNLSSRQLMVIQPPRRQLIINLSLPPMCRRSIECVYLTHGLLASRALTPCITPLTAISAITLHPQNSHSDAASDFVAFCRLRKSPDTGWARLLAGSPQRAALPALNKSSSWSDAASQASSDSFSYSFTPHLFLPGLTVPDLRRRLQNRFHTHRHDCDSIACRLTQPG
jgi:hypothetical protein